VVVVIAAAAGEVIKITMKMEEIADQVIVAEEEVEVKIRTMEKDDLSIEEEVVIEVVDEEIITKLQTISKLSETRELNKWAGRDRTTTIETTTTPQVTDGVVVVETIEVATIIIEVAEIIVTTIIKIEIRNIQINCKILMISIIMRVKEWRMQVVISKIKGSLTIRMEDNEVEEEEEVEVVVIEIMLGTKTKTQKLLEKEWHQTSNMNIH
jgi:hypothetical protein